MISYSYFIPKKKIYRLVFLCNTLQIAKADASGYIDHIASLANNIGLVLIPLNLFS